MRQIIITLTTLIALAGIATAACAGSNGSDSDGSTASRATADQAASFESPAEQTADEEASQVAFEAASESARTDSVAAASAAPNSGSLPNTGPGTDLAVQIDARRVIQDASLTLRVEDVRLVTVLARQIAETLGGFVEQLSFSGSTNDADGFVVIRVPQSEFFTAIERLSALGEVLGESVSSQDVTAQFVDLEAQLRSLTRQEGRLLDLLERANTISEILVLEGELIRIRTQIERLQGSLNVLDRRVALATITVSLIPPRGFVTEPPTADLSIQVERGEPDEDRVERALQEVKDLAERLGGAVERSSLRVIRGESVATVRLFVPRDVFQQAVDSIENLGDSLQKTLEEGGQARFLGLPAGVVVEEPDEPDALIDVRLTLQEELVLAVVEEKEDSDTALIASLSGSLGGVTLLLGLAIWRLRRRPALRA